MKEQFANLIVSPHVDDEVLGCYSFLNEKSFICYLGAEDRPEIPREQRLDELKKCSEIKKFKWHIYDNTVNNYQVNVLISQLEEQINTIKPVNVFIPHYSYNQDHQAVYKASIIALRPHDKNWFVNRVFVYEECHVFLWPVKNFNPNFFKRIDIEDKIKTYKIYDSQVRGHRSPETLKAMAVLRGKQANLDFAEAFYCKRFIFDE